MYECRGRQDAGSGLAKRSYANRYTCMGGVILIVVVAALVGADRVRDVVGNTVLNERVAVSQIP